MQSIDIHNIIEKYFKYLIKLQKLMRLVHELKTNEAKFRTLGF